MAKKRLIFTLFVTRRGFMLSRNFRLQFIGDTKWLFNNYKFSNCASSIDELVIINTESVPPGTPWLEHLVRQVTRDCFVPVTVGGGIRSVEDVRGLLRIGADKVLLNHCMYYNCDVVSAIADEFGRQAIVASIDYRRAASGYEFRLVDKDRKAIFLSADEYFSTAKPALGKTGELLLNSIDKDGTGTGYDLNVLSLLSEFDVPLIIGGGAGRPDHFIEALSSNIVSGASTGNLLNFIGDSLQVARLQIKDNGVELADFSI